MNAIGAGGNLTMAAGTLAGKLGVEPVLRTQVVGPAELETGLVDNEIAAVDEVWSGLRFIRRLANR